METDEMDVNPKTDTDNSQTNNMDNSQSNNMDSSQSNESDMNLSEWQIVSSEEEKECPKEEDPEDTTVAYSSEKDQEDYVPKGSSVEDVVEELEDPPQCESSCSSSDIDIIDESSLEYSHNNISIPSIELSLSSSFETNFGVLPPALPVKDCTPPPKEYTPPPKEYTPPPKECTPPPKEYTLPPKEYTPPPRECTPPSREYTPVREYTPEPVTDIVVQRDRFQRNPYCIILGIGCLLAIFMHIPETPVDIIKEMEKRIMTLQEENRGLKSQVISKIEDDKLFVALEEQIKALKGENSKLSQFMQDLIRELEEKTIIFKKESESEGKESYQKEVDKLKERVNILQIDNDDLQKQLVRMRYGVYSTRAQDPQSTDASSKKESSEDKSESQNENSTELLSEEIKELRKKLYSEVEKLKNWKESVQHLMKDLENRPKEFDKKQDSGDKDKAFKKNKDNRHEGSSKDSNSDPNQIPQLNITDLVFRYIGVDKKKVKDVFESVGHYFKKAQERTKDIFDENMKNDMWNFIGGLRKQWHMMKKAYFPKHAKKGQAPGDDDYKRYPEKPEASHKKDSTFQTKHGDKSRPETEQERGRRMSHDNQRFDARDEFKKEPSGGRFQENSKWKTYEENLKEATASLNSWHFERAAHRSELRQKEEEVNWYLKNRKEADFYEPDNLERDESTDDPFENIDLFAMD